MIVSVAGEAKTGKSTFAYTAPRKIVGFSFDIGVRRALYGVKHKQFEGLDIEIIPWVQPVAKPKDPGAFKAEVLERAVWGDHDITIYELPESVQLTEVKIGVREQWQAFLTLYQTALQDPLVRTVVLDTASLARRAAADAWLQELQEGEPDVKKKRKQLIQIEWGKPNDAIRNIYSLTAATGTNLIVVHHLKDERRGSGNDSVVTGNRIPEGLNDSERFWDVGIRTKVDRKNEVSLIYDVCGYNLSLQKTPVAGDTWDAMVNQIDGSLGNRLDLERTE